MNRAQIESAALVLLCLVAGLTAADLDLPLGLGHRSGLTHSVLPSALACLHARLRPAACGLAGGSAVHLSADCFPNAMIGYATVKLPIVGALDAGASYLWLAINAALALALALFLLRRLHVPPVAMLLAGAGGLAALVYLYRTDGGWPVLALIALAGGAAWWVIRRRPERPRRR